MPSHPVMATVVKVKQSASFAELDIAQFRLADVQARDAGGALLEVRRPVNVGNADLASLASSWSVEEFRITKCYMDQ